MNISPSGSVNFYTQLIRDNGRLCPPVWYRTLQDHRITLAYLPSRGLCQAHHIWAALDTVLRNFNYFPQTDP
eukprot:12410935-Karenia_brevis.AAC.1